MIMTEKQFNEIIGLKWIKNSNIYYDDEGKRIIIEKFDDETTNITIEQKNLNDIYVIILIINIIKNNNEIELEIENENNEYGETDEGAIKILWEKYTKKIKYINEE